MDSAECSDCPRTSLGLYSDFFWLKVQPNFQILVLMKSKDSTRTVLGQLGISYCPRTQLGQSAAVIVIIIICKTIYNLRN